jgi:hypothetical protein
LRLGQFDLPQASIACESLCLDRAHRRSPIKLLTCKALVN